MNAQEEACLPVQNQCLVSYPTQFRRRRRIDPAYLPAYSYYAHHAHVFLT